MRDCFDHYMRGETYDHIRMDLLFNIYGFSASVWKDTVGRDGKTPAVPDCQRKENAIVIITFGLSQK